MSKVKVTIAAITATLAGAALVVAGAAPAFADGRTIPAGDQMFLLDCAGAEVLNIQLYGVDSFTGAVTPIGDGTPTVGDGCAMQAAYDATTGISYFVEQRDIDGVFQSLFTVDTVTGESTAVGVFLEGDDQIDVISIAIAPDGAAYAIDEGGDFYSLDLATAAVTSIATLAVGTIYGFAADPTSGVFYVVTNDDLYTLNVTSGVLTPVYELELGVGTNAVSMQVDSAGVLWFLNDPDGAPNLWSATTTPDSEVLSGGILDGETEVFTQSLLVIPGKPALPATGADFNLGLLAAGAATLLAGAALLAFRRRVTA